MFKRLVRFSSPKRRNQILIKVIILLISAFFLTWLLQYRYFLNNATETWDFVRIHNVVFLYSVLIMFTIELLFYGVIRRPFLAVSVVTSIILVVGYIHIEKFNLRGVPLFPEDFQLTDQAGVMTQFVDMFSIAKLVLAVILTLAVGLILDILTADRLLRERNSNDIWWKRYLLASRVAIAAVAVLGFMGLTDFARNHDGTRTQELPWLNSHFTAWNQIWNYNDNGFILGFLYNSNKSILKEPDGYSEEKISEIVEEYQSKDGDDFSSTDYNVILILNESFYDPSVISEYYNYTGGDVTPNLHKIQSKYSSGQMYSIDYGGGTANIEFEVLTGLTNYWMQTVPYTNLVAKKQHVPSVASYAKKHGFETVALHPFKGGMYKRNSVLPILGFDTFLDEKDFSHTEKDGESEYINDRSAYLELLGYLKNHDKKQLVSLVTMQNHAPYNVNEYGENQFVVTNIENEDAKNSIETFLTTLNLSDKYLGEFIDALDVFDEKTVVLFYGDHSPGIFNQVLEHSDNDIQQLARLTPYFIYSNFNLPKTELPTTTPNCLTNTLFSLLNIQKNTVMNLADNVCKKQPILSENYFGEAAPFMDTDLSSYQMLTYDLVGGKQYALKN